MVECWKHLQELDPFSSKGRVEQNRRRGRVGFTLQVGVRVVRVEGGQSNKAEQTIHGSSARACETNRKASCVWFHNVERRQQEAARYQDIVPRSRGSRCVGKSTLVGKRCEISGYGTDTTRSLTIRVDHAERTGFIIGGGVRIWHQVPGWAWMWIGWKSYYDVVRGILRVRWGV